MTIGQSDLGSSVENQVTLGCLRLTMKLNQDNREMEKGLELVKSQGEAYCHKDIVSSLCVPIFSKSKNTFYTATTKRSTM